MWPRVLGEGALAWELVLQGWMGPHRWRGLVQRCDSWDTGHTGRGAPVALTLRFCFLWKELPFSFNLRESEEKDWYSGIPTLCPPHFACCIDLQPRSKDCVSRLVTRLVLPLL